MVVVYCYDLVPLRTQTRWTRRQDDVMRSEYFPGLDPEMLIASLRRAGRLPGGGCHLSRAVANRLSELGLRKRR